MSRAATRIARVAATRTCAAAAGTGLQSTPMGGAVGKDVALAGGRRDAAEQQRHEDFLQDADDSGDKVCCRYTSVGTQSFSQIS